jgi:transcriptional regulator of arginine metabolism
LKAKRHAKIKEILRTYEVYTQGELTGKLAEAGFNVTQATISRDINELRLTKVSGPAGGLIYALPLKLSDEQDRARLNRVFKDGFVSMDYAGNMLVIHTISGMASAVGAALDAMMLPEILGSVAGDDVLMCVVRSESQAAGLMEKLRK